MPTKLPRAIVTIPKETYQVLKIRAKKEKKSLSKIILVAILALLASGCSKHDQAKGPGLLPGQSATVCPHCETREGPCPC